MTIPGMVKIRALWDTLRTSYWFVPALMAVTATLLWLVVNFVDMRLGEKLVNRLGWIYTGGPEGARELLGIVAGSMITVAGVTFSITIVALTLASQQFGPFLLRNFMRDTGNQLTLGTFISTFIFCLLTLRVVRGTDEVTLVPHLSVSVAMLLALSSLGVLIYFIHHVSASIQASNMIAVVSDDLRHAIDRLFPEKVGLEANDHRENSPWDESSIGSGSKPAPIVSSGHGYLFAIDDDVLLRVAVENDLIVKLAKRPGDFVGEGDEIASVYPADRVDRSVKKGINETFLLGAQRTATQDVEFVFSQIVEVAVRALSPGVNDPFTAIICIDHLGQGLRRMGGRATPSPFRCAKDGTLRIIARPVTFSEMADLSFDQIRHYGRSDAKVLIHLLKTIIAVAGHVTREEDRQSLRCHAEKIMEAGALGLAQNNDRADLKNSYYEALNSLERN